MMKKVLIEKDKIELSYERKKSFFRKSVPVIETIKLTEISKVGRGEYKGELYDVTMFCKDNNEFYVSSDEVFDLKILNELYDFLCEKSNEYGYIVEVFDIETLDVKISL